MQRVKITNRTTNETELHYFGNVESSMRFYLEMKVTLSPAEFRIELGTDGLIRLKGVTMY